VPLVGVVGSLLAPGPELPGYGAMLLRVILALAGVCLLAYVVLRFLSRRGYGGASPDGLLRLVARLHLEPRRAVYVVEAAGRYFLVGTGESGAPTTLAELDAEAVQKLTAAPPKAVSFLEVLRGRRDGPHGGDQDAGTGASGAGR